MLTFWHFPLFFNAFNAIELLTIALSVVFHAFAIAVMAVLDAATAVIAVWDAATAAIAV